MRREMGATDRKLPFMVQYLEVLKSVIGLTTIDHLIVWCVTLLGRFFAGF